MMGIYGGCPGFLVGVILKMSRLHIGRFNGTDVWEGKCEGCGAKNRIAFDESVQRYLGASCLEAKDTPTKGNAFASDPNQPFPITINGHSKATTVFRTNTRTQRYL